MLVLQRYEGEEIIIKTKHGELIVVMVTRAKTTKAGTGSATIGIDADESTVIHRREVYEAIQRQGEEDERTN